MGTQKKERRSGVWGGKEDVAVLVGMVFAQLPRHRNQNERPSQLRRFRSEFSDETSSVYETHSSTLVPN